jgi:hypothetical protein
MPTPEALFDRLKKTLAAYAKSGRPESQAALADILVEVERTGALKAVGCQESGCRVCSWGKEDAQDWKNQCRLWAFAEVIEDSSYTGRRGNAAVQQEARELLEALKASPLPVRKK